MDRRSNFLVTGGCGFIGSRLVTRLVSKGHSVQVLDDLSTGDPGRLPEGTKLTIGDVADPATVEPLVNGSDGVYHLAAVASVEQCLRRLRASHVTNTTGLVTVLEAATSGANPAAVPIVYASSAAVYGTPTELPTSEDSPCHPLSPYGADKLSGELHANAAAITRDARATGLRFFNVYGPGQDPRSPYSGVISIFGRCIASAAPLIIHGDGLQVRDFVYVDDVIDALAAAMQNLQQHGPKHTVYNVCSGRSTTIRDLTTILATAAGVIPEVRFAETRKGDIRTSLGTAKRIGKDLSWHARTPLETGLQRTMQWLAEGCIAVDREQSIKKLEPEVGTVRTVPL